MAAHEVAGMRKMPTCWFGKRSNQQPAGCKKKIHSRVDTIGVHMAGCLQVKPCCTHPPSDIIKNNKGNKNKTVKASQITQNRHVLKRSYWNGEKCSGTDGVSPPGKRLSRIRHRLYCPWDWGSVFGVDLSNGGCHDVGRSRAGSGVDC